MLTEFQSFGHDLFLAGLNSSHSGNMSVRMGDRLIITRRGAMLGRLREGDLIETGIEKNDSNIILASTEIRVHRAIYQNTAALAIVHAHPVSAVALSLLEDEIIPLDSEGKYLLRKIPVLSAEYTIGSQELALTLPEALNRHKIVMVKGHGSFAIGQLLEEAYQWTSALEHISRIVLEVRNSRFEVRSK